MDVVSKGFVRSKGEKLMLVQGGAGPETVAATQAFYGGETAIVLRQQDDAGVATLDWQAPQSKTTSVADKRAEARMKGYVGEACPECANFTLVRNGTCLKCDTCGSTTGCS
jgi:ribonucleoside-diphosphate reductase alpha chain